MKFPDHPPLEPTILRTLGIKSIESISSGLSGASIYRCHHQTGRELVLRGWPKGFSQQRLAEITRVVGVSRSALASLIPQIHSFDPSVFNLRDCPTSLNRNGSGVEAISKECSTRSLSTDSLFAASKDADLSSIDSLSASSHRVVDHLWGATQNEREQSVWQSANRSLIRDCCWLSSAGRFWQLMDWMPGSVLPSECDTELILRGVEAIKRFHGATSWFGTHRQMPLAIQSRMQRIDRVTSLLDAWLLERGEAIGEAIGEGVCEELGDVVQRAIGLWRQDAVKMKRRILSQLMQDSSRPLPTQFVLRDIHRENLLFEDGCPSGFFDFDALRVDTPWIDLSRWVGSFVQGNSSDDELWVKASQIFARDHPSLESRDSDFGCDFAKRLHGASTWISLGNWLVWLLIEKRFFAVDARVISLRLDRLASLGSHLVTDQT
ncbi:aminoglycoside phosphotransferase family protein [bacterium]|nr:aminoglycoside phosphotransferase family protein [bacterium]